MHLLLQLGITETVPAIISDVNMNKSQILLIKWYPNIYFTVDLHSSQYNIAYTISIKERSLFNKLIVNLYNIGLRLCSLVIVSIKVFTLQLVNSAKSVLE